MKILIALSLLLSPSAFAGERAAERKHDRLVSQRKLSGEKKYYQLRRKDFASDDAYLSERCRLSGGVFDTSVGQCSTY